MMFMKFSVLAAMAAMMLSTPALAGTTVNFAGNSQGNAGVLGDFNTLVTLTGTSKADATTQVNPLDGTTFTTYALDSLIGSGGGYNFSFNEPLTYYSNGVVSGFANGFGGNLFGTLNATGNLIFGSDRNFSVTIDQNVGNTTLSFSGVQNASYTTTTTPTSAVPESATWMMMIAGFGMLGVGMRRRSNVKTTVAYA
jgi:hypothetical protein